MEDSGLWKYCTKQQCKDFLISLNLFGNTDWTEKEQIVCLYAISNHIEHHYRTVIIKKRDNTQRKLRVPDFLLKKIQRNILHHILYSMVISPYATAYIRGKGIADNAAAHVGKTQILKLDLTDFFGSIPYYMVKHSAFPEKYFPRSVSTLLTSLCCDRESLPQGAPTSAAISNLVLRPFDDHMGEWCTKQGISYTRYCDDITFSGDFDAWAVKNKAISFLEAMGFTLNKKKTRLLTAGRRQYVTGIVVNKKPQVPADYRKKLRQELYYCKKFGVESHLEQIGATAYLSKGQQGIRNYLMVLLGRINFVLQVNPGDSYFQDAELICRKLLSAADGKNLKLIV